MNNTSPASSSTSTVLNKILIPVITTVLGATAIYFLGFNNKSGRSDMEKMLVTKEATVKAWKSFVATQNISFQNTTSLSDEYLQKVVDEAKQGFDGLVPILKDYREELIRESKKSEQDIQALLEKEQDIDRDFASMLKRSLDNERDQQKKAISFFDNLISITKSDISNQEKAEKWKTFADKFTLMAKNVEKRSATEAEGIAKTLSEKYSQAFDLNELLVYAEYKKEKEKNTTGNTGDPVINRGDPAPKDPNAGNNGDDPNNVIQKDTDQTPASLTGKWEMDKGYLELSANGDMYWSFTGKGYTSGDWKLINGKLEMNATNPDTKKVSLLLGSLSDITANSFTLTLLSTPPEVYKFRKKN